MKIGVVCPASLPATQFGGIMFLCLDIARGSAALGHNVTIYTTDLDFANNATTFNKNLSRKEVFKKMPIRKNTKVDEKLSEIVLTNLKIAYKLNN